MRREDEWGRNDDVVRRQLAAMQAEDILLVAIFVWVQLDN